MVKFSFLIYLAINFLLDSTYVIKKQNKSFTYFTIFYYKTLLKLIKQYKTIVMTIETSY